MTADWSPLWLGLRVALMVSVLALVVAPWARVVAGAPETGRQSRCSRGFSRAFARDHCGAGGAAFTWPVAVAAGLVRAVPYTLALAAPLFQSSIPAM